MIDFRSHCIFKVSKIKLEIFKFQENRTFTATGYYNMGYGRQYVDRRTDWRDVILPAMPTQAPGLQTMSYVIRALEPAQIYEAKVQSRNKYGWSPISEAFTFQTTDTGEFNYFCLNMIPFYFVHIIVNF